MTPMTVAQRANAASTLYPLLLFLLSEVTGPGAVYGLASWQTAHLGWVYHEPTRRTVST